MNEIKTIIQPFEVDRVRSRLDAMEDSPEVSISEITGWGPPPRPPRIGPGPAFPNLTLEGLVLLGSNAA